MARFFKKREESMGLAPGHLVFIGEKKTDRMQVRLIDYDPKTVRDEELREIEEGAVALETETVSWININGLHDTEAIRAIGAVFGLHALLLEDVLNTGQRPKIEDFENVFFVVLKMLRFDKEVGEVIAEQLSLVVGPTFLLTFQEQPGDVFDPVRHRIRNAQGRVRISGTNFEYLPELHFRYGYFIFWGVMVGVAVTMLLFFKRRRWL